jgi:hypothetical protein
MREVLCGQVRAFVADAGDLDLLTDEALRELQPRFHKLYAKTGRPSIAGEGVVVDLGCGSYSHGHQSRLKARLVPGFGGGNRDPLTALFILLKIAVNLTTVSTSPANRC